MPMTHDDLAASLAGHLRGPDRMVWYDIQLGPSGSPRPDVYTLQKSFVRPTPMAYEVKVSTSDFRADVTAGKWQSYLTFACGVVFACHAGLLERADVPEHCGLIELRGERWRYAKRPTLRPVEVPERAWLKLLIDGVAREGGAALRRRAWSSMGTFDAVRKRHGEHVALAVRNLMAADDVIKDAERQARYAIESADRRAKQITEAAAEKVAPLRAELCRVLDLRPDANEWEMREAVSGLRASIAAHPAVTSLAQVVVSLERTMLLAKKAHEEVTRGAA